MIYLFASFKKKLGLISLIALATQLSILDAKAMNAEEEEANHTLKRKQEDLPDQVDKKQKLSEQRSLTSRS